MNPIRICGSGGIGVERNERQASLGFWLFRHRGYMPAFFAMLFLPASEHFRLLGINHQQQIQWELFCLGISMLGLTLRILTVAFISEASSGRERSRPQAEQLNTTGIYSLIRHPLYLGNSIIWLGVASTLHLWWLSFCFMLISLVYHRLIIYAEENYLRSRFGAVYIEWANKTPAFIPAIHNWAAPSLPFSMAMVLRREYSGLFQIIAAFALINAGLNYVMQGVWNMDSIFQYLLLGTTLICAAIWFVVKRTDWLPAPVRRRNDKDLQSREDYPQ